MSENQDDSGPGQREVAYRMFAGEFNDSDFSYSESDEERAPNYVITPTGARANRVFVVGVLTEVETVGEDVLRGRVVDPTGAFVLYAGQYQPDEMAFLDRAETPSFVAVTGKARTFQPDDSDAVYTSIRPESISTVDAATRDRWTVQTAEQTLQRIGYMATALSLDVRGDALTETLVDHGVSESLADGIALAIDHYDTSPAYLSALRETALDAARVVSGDIDEVEAHTVAPDAAGEADLSALVDTSVEVTASVDGANGMDAPEEADTTETEDVEATPSASETEVVSDDAEPDAPEADGSTTDSETDSAPVESDDTVESTEPEPTTPSASAEAVESEPVAASESDTDDVGAAEIETEESDNDIGEFEPGEFDLDDSEREEIEEEFGTEFQSGADVPEPGEADIETPDPEALPEETHTDDSNAEPVTQEPEPDGPEESAEPVESESASESTEPEVESAEDETDEADEDVDIDEAVIDVMEELDEGDGTERSVLIETLTDRFGVSEGEVEDAIQDALMSGQCYEPDDTTLKSI